MFKRIFIWAAVVIAGMTLYSCENGEKTGQDYVDEIVNNFNHRIFHYDNFSMRDGTRIYLQGMESAEASKTDCSVWIYDNMQGDSYEFTLPDGMGTVKVSPLEEAGEFYRVSFDLHGVEPFKLDYVEPGKISDDNFLPRPVNGNQTAL